MRTDGRTDVVKLQRQTDRQTGTTKLLIAFREFAKALKMPTELMMMMMMMFSQTVNHKHQTDLSEDRTGLNRSLVTKFKSCYETRFYPAFCITPRHWTLSRGTERNQLHLFSLLVLRRHYCPMRTFSPLMDFSQSAISL